MTATRLYGTAVARARDRLHPRLTHRSAWTAQLGALPVIEGTVIRLQVEHLPSGATPEPVWLWWSGPDATTVQVDRLWQAFLRRSSTPSVCSSRPWAGPARRSALLKPQTAGPG
ncbi:hypothetical protein [Streptomyces sp. V2I9]|uniref:hypothetical protein n=1 Tax=Streptomyces sp. V2I9 TaxID=3042304 RepID=UPI0027803914|nr:hypothetical protein [Streptomyces sp. V2I9]MDQ0983127.1 hypothetical protein [Streptomyces sp. V2I9]